MAAFVPLPRLAFAAAATAGALLAPLSPAVAALGKAELATARALIEQAQQSELAWQLVSSLTTEVGPRLAGTAGDRAGVEWAARTLQQLGFENVRTMEVIVPRWTRGEATLAIVEPFRQPLTTAALGGSIGTHDEGVRADAIPVRNLAELASLDPKRVEGKIVFFTQRMERTRDASGYSAAVSVRVDGPAAAASKGAVAVVIRSVGTSSNRFAHTGTTRYSLSSPRIPAVSISNPDADQLERMFATGKPVKLALNVTARDLPQTRSANVIGEIPGTDRAEEIVLLGAHLDSWDLGTGALDDGAGVAIVTAAARLLKDVEPKPRRTLRVVLFANEEFGLSGAQTYAAEHARSMNRHVLAMEADLGAGPVWQLSSRVAPISLPLVQEIHSVLRPLGVKLGNNEASGGADIGPLRVQGVPVLSPHLDASLYFDYHHTANDTLDKVDPEHLKQAVAVYAATAYLAASAEEGWPQLPPAATQ